MFNKWTLAFGLALAFAHAAFGADDFPRAPVKVVVPYGAGGVGDVVARIVAEKAAADLGQPVVIDNRSGANGIIGLQAVKQSKADGYTVLLLATGHVILPSVQQVPYDLAKDFVPVFGVTATPLVFAVNAKSGIHSISDLAKVARTTPKGLNYASGGSGSVSHLAAARLVHELKINGTHVPFRGFNPAVQALMGDQVHFICATVADVLELTRSGDFRVIGVTADARQPLLPQVPTMKEQGYTDFTAASWNAYLAPAGTPPEAVERLNRAFARAAADPAVQERIGRLGVSVIARTRAELDPYLKDESVRWRKVIAENAIKIEN